MQKGSKLGKQQQRQIWIFNSAYLFNINVSEQIAADRKKNESLF